MIEENGPDYGKLIFIPALITLGITLLRLAGELMNLPGWLASKEAGGGGALIGVAWLPPILGIYFAYKLADFPGKLWRNLLKTLFFYGLAARLPVIVIMGLAIFGEWGTHYDAFPPFFPTSLVLRFLLGGVVAQLVFWAFVWTVGTGMITGMSFHKIRSAGNP